MEKNVWGSDPIKREPWINIEDKDDDTSVEKCIKNNNSILKLYKELIKLRYRTDTLMYGKYKEISYNNGVLSFIRHLDKDEIEVIINYGEDIYTYDSSKETLYKNNEKDGILEQFNFVIHRI